jgi:hypothetical protein
MKLLALAIPLLVAATAHAQAPGDMTPMAYGPGAGPSAVEPVVVASDAIPVMANRWAVGLSVGSLSIRPKDAPDNKTDFAIGQLSLRFRATYHLEIELALGGGQEKLQDGTQGDREVSTGELGLRYRFAADRRWNWWLGGGIGSLSVTPVGATDQQKQDAQLPMASLSIGIEHRWHQFALDAELRGFGVGPRDASAAPPKAMPVASGTTMMDPPPPSPAPSQDLSGGTFTIGASYYF